MKDNRLIEIFEANKRESKEFSLLLLQYLTFTKKYKVRDLELLMPKEEYINLEKEQKKELLYQFIDLRKQTKNERLAYLEFIKLHIKKNLLNIKINQLNLSREELKKLNIIKDNQEEEINSFDTKRFNLGIENILDFIELLNKSETIYNCSYRDNEFFFKDLDLINKINSLDLSNEDTLNTLTSNFFKEHLDSFEEEIVELLFEKMIKLLNSSFKNPHHRNKETFFDILGKILSKELKAFKVFTQGVTIG